MNPKSYKETLFFFFFPLIPSDLKIYLGGGSQNWSQTTHDSGNLNHYQKHVDTCKQYGCHTPITIYEAELKHLLNV